METADIPRHLSTAASALMAPLTLPIPEACRISGLSRSEIYRRLAAGDMLAVKSGNRTLILMESLRAYLAGLPAARFRAPKQAA